MLQRSFVIDILRRFIAATEVLLESKPRWSVRRFRRHSLTEPLLLKITVSGYKFPLLSRATGGAGLNNL